MPVLATLRPVVSCLMLLLMAACTNAVAPAAPPKPLVFAVIGASDSVGIGASNPAKTGWVPVLHAMLPIGTRLVNVGIDGARVATALEQEMPIVLDVQPDIVAVWITVNDINAKTPLAEYERDLDRLLTDLSSNTHARVFLANVPNLNALPIYKGVPPATISEEVDRWNAVINRLAAAHGATLVDLNQSAYSRELKDHPEYVSSDGFHPSDAGYKRLADLFYASFEANGVVPARD